MMLLATIVPVNGYALSIDELLRPFLSVIQEVNAKYGVVLTIPEDNKESVYERLRMYTPEQYKLKLIKQISSALAEQNTQYDEPIPEFSTAPSSDSGVVTPFSVVDDYSETKNFGLGLLVRLDGKIKSISGDPGTYTFTSISGIYAREDKTYPGFHYYPMSSSYQYLNSRKQCKVTVKCGKRNEDGVVLTGIWYPSKTYSAG